MNDNFEENINFPNYWNWNGFKICWSVLGEDNEIPIIRRNNIFFFVIGIHILKFSRYLHYLLF